LIGRTQKGNEPAVTFKGGKKGEPSNAFAVERELRLLSDKEEEKTQFPDPKKEGEGGFSGEVSPRERKGKIKTSLKGAAQPEKRGKGRGGKKDEVGTKVVEEKTGSRSSRKGRILPRGRGLDSPGRNLSS